MLVRRLRVGSLSGTLLALSVAATLPLTSAAVAPPPAGSTATAEVASGSAARPSIVLSSQPAELEIRQCMTEIVRLGITNRSIQSAYVDVSASGDAPLSVANPLVSTYVPAGATVTVPVQIYVPEETADGEYDLRFVVESAARLGAAAGPRGRLTVPVAVSAPEDRRCVPPSQQTVTASSSQDPENSPAKAIDGRTATIWHAKFSPDRTHLPQWITFDLGGSYDVAELSYQPRVDGNLNGTITAYTILASVDGTTFTEVTSGTWAGDATRKTAVFSAPGARYVRLLATGGVADYASAAEIVLFGQPSDVDGS